jgi:two-component system, OmpR family, phosphate regulon sensor histidine kinase PhoR
MNRITFEKLLSRWFLFMISFPVGLAWLNSEVNPVSFSDFAWQLGLLLGAISAAAVVIAHIERAGWAARVQVLEKFATALPAAEADLPSDGPPEIERLSRAMQAMSKRVRHVVERANLEASRREAILSCMAEGVLAVDGELKVVFCNEAFAEAFSARTPVPEGRALYEVVREPALRDILERVVRTGNAEKERFQLPTAGSRSFEARALPFASSPIPGAVIVLHDITDIQSQEQVRKDFVADVSHELRTPLTAIRGYAETLLDGALDDHENNRKFVDIILSHAIRLGNIASDLLVLSELDSNVSPIAPPERIPVPEVIESAMRTVENAAILRGIRLNSSCAEECFVSGHRFRLEQVLVNLLDNAVKFNRNEGEVMIECASTEDGRVRISVADTGVGIPSGETKRIFERFYRVDKARSRPAGGTGLGLPIVKEAIDRMGGTVSLESQLGRGSKFTILLQPA